MSAEENVATEVEQLLAGSCRPASDAADEFGLSEDQVNRIMVEAGHELCDACGWWCEEDELDAIDDEYVCTDCHDP